MVTRGARRLRALHWQLCRAGRRKAPQRREFSGIIADLFSAPGQSLLCGVELPANRAARRPLLAAHRTRGHIPRRNGYARHSSARADRSSANAFRCLCHEGFGRDAGATVSNGLEPSAEPSSESSVQRTRAIPASNRRFAKTNRIAGTQGRIGLNVPERHSPPAELSSRLDDGK
jgi:hypothetical protein